MLIRQLLNKNLPFVVYRLPGRKDPVCLVQTSTDVLSFDLENPEWQNGFVIAAFDAYKTGKAFLIKPDLCSFNGQEDSKLLDKIAHFPDKEIQLPEQKNYVTNKTGYLQQVRELVRRIKNGDARKVVLSRVLEKSLPSAFRFDRFFELLLQRHLTDFVYLFHLPGKGIWAGATPETLLNIKDGFCETMALAGTQKRTSGKEPVVWAAKEKEEQAFVTEFVEKQIINSGIKTYKKQAPETVFAGNLAHICTRFLLPEEVLKINTGRFVRSLHPTPAVCGLPKEKAWQLISETEKHARRFYTGFLGPWHTGDTAHLFVNLRCAEFSEKKMSLYVGGGITSGSVSEKEWQETVDKSEILLSVVEKLQNFAP